MQASFVLDIIVAFLLIHLKYYWDLQYIGYFVNFVRKIKFLGSDDG